MDDPFSICKVPTTSDNQLVDRQSQIFIQYRNRLTQYIAFLFDTDFTKLIQLLYRLDVSEKKYKYVLDSSLPEQMAEHIADLIIEREIKKIQTRQAYKDDEGTVDWEF